jgi:glyoxylate/hydroxypyruvate reductase A
MSLLVAVSGWAPDLWLKLIRDQAGELEVVEAREAFDPAAVEYAAVWKPAPGLLARLPNLKAIVNLGAGVDALLADQTLPDVPLVRIVDPDLTQRMTEYVVWQVLHHHRGGFHYRDAQARSSWTPLPDQPAAADVRVGILGLGVLGRDAAGALVRLGFQVSGWSRSRGADIAGVEIFAGKEELDLFLGATDILVVLLPLTPETRGCLDRALFQKLARDGRLAGPALINAGRGGLQNEDDLLACLDDGTLTGASLDVFVTEPLAATSPLWSHPRVVVTPHSAADSDPRHLVRYVLQQVKRSEAGEPLANVVDRAKGY